MSDTVSLREFFEHEFKGLDKKVDAILTEVRATNGRVRRAEIAIAILQWAYALGVPVIAWIVYKIA